MTLYSPGGLNLADTTAPLILAYDDGGSSDVVFSVSASGDLTITPDGGDVTLACDLTVSGTGPHAIGTSPVGHAAFRHGGSFTSDGSSTVAFGVDHNHILTGFAGDTTYLVGTRLSPAINTQTATENIGVIATLYITEPSITDNLTGDITVAATLYIASAPTEGETNADIWIAGTNPAIQFGGDTQISRTTGGGLTLDNGFTVSSGNVGIGQAAGASSLMVTETDVSPILYLTNSHASTPNGIFVLFSGTTPDNNSEYFFHGSDGTSRVFLYSDGDGLNADGTWGIISDERFKSNLTPARSQWNDVKALASLAINYQLTEDGPDSKVLLGWGAQSVQAAGMGGLVMECSDGDETFLGLRSSIIHTKTTIAVGEALCRIEALEADNRSALIEQCLRQLLTANPNIAGRESALALLSS